jgi:hypothetical protein
MVRQKRWVKTLSIVTRELRKKIPVSKAVWKQLLHHMST